MKINRQNYDNIWFTSDWHYSHNKPFIVDYRGFASIEAHDKFIVDEFNRLVGPRDLVFNLGDFIFRGDVGCEDVLRQLPNGDNMYFVHGNHDKVLKKYLKGIQRSIDLGPYYEVSIIEDEDRTDITLTHFPMLGWNKSHYGSWNLCGHSHGSHPETLPNNKIGKRLDVGIDVGIKYNDTFMFSYEDVKAIMVTKNQTAHH